MLLVHAVWMYSVHRQPVDSPHKGPAIRKFFPCFGSFMPLKTNSWNVHQSIMNFSFKNEFEYRLQNGSHIVSASLCRNYQLNENAPKQNKNHMHVSWDILNKVIITVFTTNTNIHVDMLHDCIVYHNVPMYTLQCIFAKSSSLIRCVSLQWRHNGRYVVSNHQPHHCFLNRLFIPRSKKTSKLRVTGLCARTSPVTGEFTAQMASNVEKVSISWRHHVVGWTYVFNPSRAELFAVYIFHFPTLR